MSVKEWLSRYPVLQAKYYRLYGDPNSEATVEILRKEMDAIENTIKAINDPLYSEVLILRYTEGPTGRLMPWRDVAFAMYHNDAEADILRAQRLHRKALDMVKLPEK